MRNEPSVLVTARRSRISGVTSALETTRPATVVYRGPARTSSSRYDRLPLTTQLAAAPHRRNRRELRTLTLTDLGRINSNGSTREEEEHDDGDGSCQGRE